MYVVGPEVMTVARMAGAPFLRVVLEASELVLNALKYREKKKTIVATTLLLVHVLAKQKLLENEFFFLLNTVHRFFAFLKIFTSVLYPCLERFLQQVIGDQQESCLPRSCCLFFFSIKRVAILVLSYARNWSTPSQCHVF